MLQTNGIYWNDALGGLKQLDDESIDCVITSPPYWALRDFGLRPFVWDNQKNCKHSWQPLIRNPMLDRRNKSSMAAQGAKVGNNVKTSAFALKNLGQFCARCRAWKGCLGLEPTIELYLQHLCGIFNEVKRVLKSSGTCWVNLGDTYHTSMNWTSALVPPQTICKGNSRDYNAGRRSNQGLPEKCLCLIPERFAIEMVKRGWILRNKVVWHKPNHMPSSVKDRLTCSWENIFFFVKSRCYFFDLDSVRVPHKSLNGKNVENLRPSKQRFSPHIRGSRQPPNPGAQNSIHLKGKNPGDFWKIPAETKSLDVLITRSTV